MLGGMIVKKSLFLFSHCGLRNLILLMKRKLILMYIFKVGILLGLEHLINEIKKDGTWKII